MTLCGDHAFFYFHFSCRSNQLTCAGTCHIAGLTDRSDYADGTCVSQGQLNLGLRTYRPKDRSGEFLLASYDLYFLVAGKLTRLRQVFFLGQLIALAEQSLQILLSYMYVTSRCFNNEFHNIHSPFINVYCGNAAGQLY